MSKKITALILASILAMSALVGCGGKDVAQGDDKPESKVDAVNDAKDGIVAKDVVYPIPGGGKLVIADDFSSFQKLTTDDYSKLPLIQQLMEDTGVELEYIHPSDADAWNLLFASGEYPDIINHYNFISYPGGPGKAISDQIIYPITDIMTEHAPALTKQLASNEYWRKSSVTNDGDYIGFPFIRRDPLLQSFMGLIVNENFLEELDMAPPTTLDQFTQMLRAFKDELGVKKPFSANNDFFVSLYNYGTITSPFGIPKFDFYQEDGVVKYGQMEEGAKDVIAYLNMLYTEKLLDNDYGTIDSATMHANMMNGTSGATFGYVGGGMGNYLNTMNATDPDYSVAGLQSLVKNEGDVPMSNQVDTAIVNFTVITSQCENKELAAQFLNYFYTEDGHNLINFGIEGESYDWVTDYPGYEGTPFPEYTEEITNNPEGLTMNVSMARFCESWGGGGFMQDERYVVQYSALPQQTDALKKWSIGNGGDYNLPSRLLDDSEAREYSTIMGDLQTYKDEMIAKFITGLVPMDKWETEFIPTLEDFGIARAIELEQKSLDAFDQR